MNDSIPVSRRSMISGAGAVLAVAGVGTEAAAATGGEPDDAVATMPDDPTSKYPKPPFKSRSQPWPGLAVKMQPPPDHGETSYRGSGRLSGARP